MKLTLVHHSCRRMGLIAPGREKAQHPEGVQTYGLDCSPPIIIPLLADMPSFDPLLPCCCPKSSCAQASTNHVLANSFRAVRALSELLVYPHTISLHSW